MSILHKATCLECGYEGQFCLGSGLGNIDLFQSIRALDQAEQAEIKNMYENGEISRFAAENKLTRCSHCNMSGQLKDKAIITIIDQSQRHRNFGHRCSSCGSDLEIYEEQASEKADAVVCPNMWRRFSGLS